MQQFCMSPLWPSLPLTNQHLVLIVSVLDFSGTSVLSLSRLFPRFHHEYCFNNDIFVANDNDQAANAMKTDGDVKVKVEGDSTPKENQSVNKKSKKSVDESSDLAFTWICTECREAECIDDPDAPLIICDGLCDRPFHPRCANLSRVPPDDSPWYCNDCLQCRHACGACGEYGADGEEVYKCDEKKCGMFFHENCLNMYDVDVMLVEEERIVMLEDEDGAPTNEKTMKTVTRPKFKCPAHQCWTCSAGRPLEKDDQTACHQARNEKATGSKQQQRGKKRQKAEAVWATKKERLFRCLECPTSYHITCMPPNCRFHELAMLCHEHAHTSKLPYLDVGNSFQAKVEADAERMIRRLEKRAEDMKARISAQVYDDDVDYDEDDDGWWAGKKKENPFLPGLVGSAVMFEEERLAEFLEDAEEEEIDDDGEADNDDDITTQPKKRRKRRQYNYCLPLDFMELVHSKPPTFNHVNANRYDPKNRPKRHPPTGETCQCQPSTEDGGIKSCGDGCLNRLNYVECVGVDKTLNKTCDKNPYSNCDCGPSCGNRAMSQRQFAKCRPAREHGKGWGLVTVNGVTKGDMIQEYVGEIIDEKTKESRLMAWSRDHPNDPNFYVMHLEPGWYIDAREVANQARFINHSCDPNCKLVPINVAGRMRVSIVCIKDVPPGGFLAYDYGKNFFTKFTCRCGATNCRGMKAGETDEKTEKKTKKQLISEAKSRVQRDKRFLQSVIASEKDRLYLTGPLIPGSDADKIEMVAGGPQERYRDESRGIFLWRNARAGADFSSRYWRSVARKRGDKKMRKNVMYSLPCQVDQINVISFVRG